MHAQASLVNLAALVSAKPAYADEIFHRNIDFHNWVPGSFKNYYRFHYPCIPGAGDWHCEQMENKNVLPFVLPLKNLGSRKPNEIIRIPIDALESIYNFYKISGAEAFGKYANWS